MKKSTLLLALFSLASLSAVHTVNVLANTEESHWELSTCEEDIKQMNLTISGTSIDDYSICQTDIVTFLKGEKLTTFYVAYPNESEEISYLDDPEVIIRVGIYTQYEEIASNEGDVYRHPLGSSLDYRLNYYDSYIVEDLTIAKFYCEDERILDSDYNYILDINYSKDGEVIKHNYIRDEYIFDEETSSLQEQVIDLQHIEILNGYAFTRVAKTYEANWWDDFCNIFTNYDTIDDWDCISYYLFDTNINDKIKRLVSVNLEYDYIEFLATIQPYANHNDNPSIPEEFNSNTFLEEIQQLDMLGIQQELHSYGGIYSFTYEQKHEVVNILDSDKYTISQGVLLGREVYEFDAIFERTRVVEEEDTFLLEKMGDRRFGIIYDYDIREVGEYTISSDDLYQGSQKTTEDDIKALWPGYIIENNSLKGCQGIKGNQVSQANILSLDFIDEGNKYNSVICKENWIENDGYFVDYTDPFDRVDSPWESMTKLFSNIWEAISGFFISLWNGLTNLTGFLADNNWIIWVILGGIGLIFILPPIIRLIKKLFSSKDKENEPKKKKKKGKK